MKRESGYYWVKYESEWMVSYFDKDGDWRLFRRRSWYQDSDFDEIIETLLLPPKK